MAQIWKDRVQQTVTGTPGTGAFTLSTASAGYQALAAGDDGKTGFFCATEGTAWETFWGTYTHSGTSLARTSRKDSSTGSAISFTSAAIVYLDIVGQAAQAMMLASSATPPGGRLTLTTAVPVTTADVTGATTIYYTPYVGNVICLWDGNIWMPTIFAEVSLALGTLTTLRPYDVFAFLTAGAFSSMEALAWTSDTARATAVTLQDGRYCKSGDKTRLYLGSFRTTSTTTTEDSGGGTTTNVGGKRFVFNMYNRRARHLDVIDTADWAYSTATIRQANGNAGNKVEFLVGLSEDLVAAGLLCGVSMTSTGGAPPVIGIGLDSTTTFAGLWGDYYNSAATAVQFGGNANYGALPGLGYHYLSWNEKGGTNASFWGDDGGLTQSGLTATVMA